MYFAIYYLTIVSCLNYLTDKHSNQLPPLLSAFECTGSNTIIII